MATGVTQPASINGTANKNANKDSRKEGKNSGVEDSNDMSVVLSDEEEDKKARGESDFDERTRKHGKVI